MATSRIRATEGSGKNVATHSFTEDAETKELQRIVPSTPGGSDQTFGAGAVSAGTPRHTLASDDPAVAALESISGKLPASVGSKADAASISVTQSTEDKAVLAAQSAKLPATLGSKADAASLSVTQSTEDKAALIAARYTEDAAAAADPVGGVMMLVRKDTPAALVTTDGDNVALRGTNFGSAFFTGLDINGTIWDLLTPPSVTLLLEKTHPTADWRYTSGATNICVATTTAVTIKAADATLRHYVDAIQVSAGVAIGTKTILAIRDGAGGTILWAQELAAAVLAPTSFSFPPGTIKSTAATLLEIVTLTSSTNGVCVSIQGHTAA